MTETRPTHVFVYGSRSTFSSLLSVPYNGSPRNYARNATYAILFHSSPLSFARFLQFITRISFLSSLSLAEIFPQDWKGVLPATWLEKYFHFGAFVLQCLFVAPYRTYQALVPSCYIPGDLAKSDENVAQNRRN